MTTRQHNVAAAILLITGAMLVRLSAVELQPIEFEPAAPIVSWLQSISSGIENNALSLRWFAVVAAGTGMWLVYLIGKRFLTHNGAVQAMILTGVSLPWITYGRQANAEIVGVVLQLAAFYAMVRVTESTSRGRMLPFAMAFILMCGLAGELSAFAVVVMVATGLVVCGTSRRWRELAIVLFGAIAARPWTFFQGESTHLSSALMLSQGAETLLIAMPISFVVIVWLIGMFFQKELRPTSKETNVQAVGLVFSLALLTALFVSHRMLLTMVWGAPFAALLSVASLERFRVQRTPTPLLIALIVLIVATYATLIHYSLNSSAVLRLLAVLSGVGWFGYMVFSVLRGQRMTTRLQLVVRLFVPAYYGAIAMNGLMAASMIVFGSPFVISGARAVAREVTSNEIDLSSTIYLYHSHSSADSISPQLRYYMQAPFRSEAISAQEIDTNVVIGLMTNRQIIYFHPDVDGELEPAIDAILSNRYQVSIATKDYTLYQLR